MNNIAAVYSDQNQKENALDYLNKALEIYRKVNNREGISYSLNNIASVLDDLQRYDEAILIHTQSLAMKKEMNDSIGMAGSYNNIADCYNRKQQPDKAISYFLKSLEIYERRKDKVNISYVLTNLAVAYQQKKDGNKAVEYAEKAIKTARETGRKENIKRASDALSSSYALIGNYKDAYRYHQLYSSEKDSILNEQTSKQINEMQAKYDMELKKDKELLKKDNEIQKKEAEGKQNALQRNFFIVGFCMMMVLAFFIFRSYREKQKANSFISIQKAIVEMKQKEIIDSINYASRIQKSQLPSEAYINKALKRLVRNIK